MNDLPLERLLATLRQGVTAWNEWRQQAKADVVDLRGIDLSGLDLPSANLSRCNLHGATLSSANLQRADLQHSDFVRAKLFQTNLGGANLRGANLRGAFLAKAKLDAADLSNATLHGTNLQGASLRGANLEWALLARCDVRGADFRKVLCGGTAFSQTKLSEARYLESAVHSRGSSLGIEILSASGTRLPVAFLRGCGIEDSVLTFLAADRADHSDKFYSVFISYSHKDRAFASQLHDRLQASGVRCWRDEKRMGPGDDIYEEVDKGIREQEKILLCASESSLSSWWVDAEIESAFAKERELMRAAKIRSPVLIPINLDGYMFSERWLSGKRRIVQSRLAADFTDPSKFGEQFKRLRKALMRTEKPAAKEAPPSS